MKQITTKESIKITEEEDRLPTYQELLDDYLCGLRVDPDPRFIDEDN